MPYGSEVIANPLEMERFGDRLDKYVAETISQCDELLEAIKSAQASGAFSGEAEQEAAQRLVNWLNAIKDPLPEATSMGAKLKEAAMLYQRGSSILRSL